MFTNNTSQTYGGALWINDTSLTVNTCNFCDNIAKYAGSIGLTNSLNVKIENSDFNNNTVMFYGGALWINDTSLTINSCSFCGNFAQNGSAIYNNGELNIFDTNFKDNKVKSYIINSSNNGPVKRGDDLIIKVTLLVGDNIVDAIYNNNTITINDKTPQESCLAKNQEIELILNEDSYIKTTNDEGIAEFVIDISNLDADKYTYLFSYIESNLYTGINNTSTVEILENPSKKETDDDILSKSSSKSKKDKNKCILKEYIKTKDRVRRLELLMQIDLKNKPPKIKQPLYKPFGTKHPNDKGLINYFDLLYKSNKPNYSKKEYYDDGGWILDGIFICNPVLQGFSYYSSWKVSQAMANTDGCFGVF